MSDVEKDNEILERNVAALLKEPPDPPRMDPAARERILALLKENIATPEPAAAAVPAMPAEARPAPAKRYSFWLPAVVGGLSVLILVGGGGGYFLYKQSQERKRQAALQAKREKEMKEELSKLKKDQDELRRINAQKDKLIQRMRTASVEEKKLMAEKIAQLQRKARNLTDGVLKRRARRRKARAGRRAGRKARPAAVDALNAF